VQTQEDKELKARLETAVEQLNSSDDDEVAEGVEILSGDIRQATSSMTSVPKPLKFLSPHYDTLRNAHSNMEDYNPVKAPLADVLSVLGMVKGAHRRDTLRYCLLGTGSDIGKWGHEYLRHLAGEVGATFEELTTEDPDADVSDLMRLVDAIVPYNMEHNSEAEAVDLLLEVGALVSLPSSGFIDEHNCTRVCEYLLQCASYLGDAEEAWEVLEVAFELYMQQHQYPNARGDEAKFPQAQQLAWPAICAQTQQSKNGFRSVALLDHSPEDPSPDR
jgi:26S proteasome regulatory subunit N1